MKKILFMAACILVAFTSQAKTYPMPGQWVSTKILPSEQAGTVTIEITCTSDAGKVCYTVSTPGSGLGFPGSNLNLPTYQGEMLGANLTFQLSDMNESVLQGNTLQSIEAFLCMVGAQPASSAAFHFQGPVVGTAPVANPQ